MIDQRPRGKRARATRRIALWAVIAAGVPGCGFFQVSEEVVRCNLVTQAECAADEACVAPNSPRCSKAGAVAVGAACVAYYDCVREAICVGSDTERFCRQRCDLAAPNCPTDEVCIAGTTEKNADGFGVCVALGCDPVAQTGCPSGQRCIPGPAPFCSAVIGVAGEGVQCASNESCKTGMVCAQGATTDANGKKISTCIQVCDVSGTITTATCGDGYRCDALLDGEGFTLPAQQGTCVLEHCNALTDFGCKDSEKCFAASKPVCGFPGNLALGDACEKVIDCGVGLICIQDSEGKRLCRAKCDTSGSEATFACPTGEVCVEIKDGSGTPLPNNVGFCRAP
ncbi:MAG: hypothetical protein H6747_02375 [Deltaproteobacteria bacterium]|nr:hypothetical protein [Deltaproteobacteria bacterium]